MRGLLATGILWSFVVVMGCSRSACCPADVVPEGGQIVAAEAFRLERAFLRGATEPWQASTDQAKGVPEPQAGVHIPENATLIALVPPDQFRLREMSLVEALSRRRSHRSFADLALDMETLSFLLWSGQGITAWATAQDGAEIGLRTTPSAGARYPIDVFVLVQRVQGLETGIYRYLPQTHELVAVRMDDAVSGEVLEACFGAGLIREAAAVFILSVVPYRTEWRYGKLAHRMIAMEAGHLVQNILLAAEASGLGGCAVGAYFQPGLDALMGFDGQEVFSVYLAAVGRLPAVGDAE
jgi:SagB-type dehydrogenase family enzyme